MRANIQLNQDGMNQVHSAFPPYQVSFWDASVPEGKGLTVLFYHPNVIPPKYADEMICIPSRSQLNLRQL